MKTYVICLKNSPWEGSDSFKFYEKCELLGPKKIKVAMNNYFTLELVKSLTTKEIIEACRYRHTNSTSCDKLQFIITNARAIDEIESIKQRTGFSYLDISTAIALRFIQETDNQPKEVAL